MGLSVLGGTLKGLNLKVPSHQGSPRPTAVLLKRKLFDAIQNWEGMFFIDACAGTGAMGIEAISRGAIGLTCCENSKKNFKNLSENIRLVQNKMSQVRFEVVNQSIIQFLLSLEKHYLSLELELQSQTMFFLDPPYEEHDLYFEVMDKIAPWFRGVLCVESDKKKGPSQNTLELKWKKNLRKHYRQGDHFLLIFEKE